MQWLFLLVPLVSVAVLVSLRCAAARRAGLPSMTPVRLSAAVSRANKRGQNELSVVLAQSDANRAVAPMGAIGWQVSPATSGRALPRSRKTAVTFARVPAAPRSRYEYLYDRGTWVRLPAHYEYLADGSTTTEPRRR